MKPLYIFTLTMITLASTAFASNLDVVKAPACDGRPDFIGELRPELIASFDKLPPLVYVAYEADFYVESLPGTEPMRVHSYQSFRNAGAERHVARCAARRVP
ncbi:MAG: hypothetical protein EOP06_22805, partial [Proteobacteria bacterium]